MMSSVRTESSLSPLDFYADHLDSFSMLLRRSLYTGLLPSPAPGTVLFDGFSHLCDQVVTISENMERAGLPATASYHRLASLPAWQRCVRSARAVNGGSRDVSALRESFREIAAPLRIAVDEMNDQIEMSPQPAGEWKPVIDTLGEDLLSRLVDASPSSLRRYANGTRSTPQDVAERLHFIAMVLADLAGSYNDFGIRRWFARPRSVLDGQSPASYLGKDFDIDGESAAAVGRLARALTGAGAA